MSPHHGLAVIALAGALAGQQSADLARLVQALGSDETVERSLLARGAEAIPTLLESLRSGEATDPARLPAALRVIGQLGAIDGDAVGELSTFLGSYIEACPSPLRNALVRARASLAPYSGDQTWSNTFHKLHEHRLTADRKEWFVQHMRHVARLEVGTRHELPACLAMLRDNVIFAREVAAEQLGVLVDADESAITALRAALVDRHSRPSGWDSLRHNGIVEPIDDEFRLRAAQALLRLAPGDERSAVGLGVLAARHPYQSVRREALRALAGFALAAKEALPDVITAMRTDDALTTVAALEVLGMIGPDGVAALPQVVRLATAADAAIANRARALQQQLLAVARRNGIEIGDESAAAPSPAVALVEQLADPAKRDAATAALVALGEEAITALLERVRADGAGTRDAVLEAIAAVGLCRPCADREELMKVLFFYTGDHWEAPRMTSSTGGTRGPLQFRLITALQYRGVGGLGDVGNRVSPLLDHLADADPLIRLEAARLIGARVRATVPDAKDATAIVAALRTARLEPHPKKSQKKIGHLPMETPVDVDADIQAAADAALESLAVHPVPEIVAKARAALAAPKKAVK